MYSALDSNPGQRDATKFIVGQVHIVGEIEHRRGYEVARWHKTFVVEPGQTVDLYAQRTQQSWDPWRVSAYAHGTCVASNFQSLFAGNPVGGGGVDREVGDVEEVPVFQATIGSLLCHMEAQDEGFKWFTNQLRAGVRVELDEDALEALGLDLDAIRHREHEKDVELKTADAQRELETVHRLMAINILDRIRLELLEAGQELPTKSLRGRYHWDVTRARSQYLHTRGSLQGALKRQHERVAHLKDFYGVEVEAA